MTMTSGPRLDHWGDIKLPRHPLVPARPAIPLPVRLCLLPGAARVVGDVTVAKARRIARMRQHKEA